MEKDILSSAQIEKEDPLHVQSSTSRNLLVQQSNFQTSNIREEVSQNQSSRKSRRKSNTTVSPPITKLQSTYFDNDTLYTRRQASITQCGFFEHKQYLFDPVSEENKMSDDSSSHQKQKNQSLNGEGIFLNENAKIRKSRHMLTASFNNPQSETLIAKQDNQIKQREFSNFKNRQMTTGLYAYRPNKDSHFKEENGYDCSYEENISDLPNGIFKLDKQLPNKMNSNQNGLTPLSRMSNNSSFGNKINHLFWNGSDFQTQQSNKSIENYLSDLNLRDKLSSHGKSYNQVHLPKDQHRVSVEESINNLLLHSQQNKISSQISEVNRVPQSITPPLFIEEANQGQELNRSERSLIILYRLFFNFFPEGQQNE